MVLCVERRMDQKNRLFIPIDFIRKAGGKPNGTYYVMLDEDTKEIKISMKGLKENEEKICDQASV